MLGDHLPRRDELLSRALRPPHRPHRRALPAPAVEPIATVRLQPGHADPLRHLELLEHLARRRIDAPHIALLTLPRAVPQLSVDPRYAGDETVRLDGAKNLPRLGIDLVDLPLARMPDPQRPLGPRESAVAA